jgi:hypothetical protein
MVGFNIKDNNGCADSVAKAVVVDSCVSNIYEYNLENKKIDRIIDLSGKETKNKKNINIIMYDNGKIEKRLIIE